MGVLINTGDYVRFWRNDCSEGQSFKEGEIHRVSKGGREFTGMVYIGDVAVWKSSLELVSKEQYDEYIKQFGITTVKSTKKKGRKEIEHFDGKELIVSKKFPDAILYSVDKGKTPKTLREAKKLLGLNKRNAKWEFEFYKDTKYNFALKNIKSKEETVEDIPEPIVSKMEIPQKRKYTKKEKTPEKKKRGRKKKLTI